MIVGKGRRGKQQEKNDVGWTNKEAKWGTSDRYTKRDEGLKSEKSSSPKLKSSAAD